MRVKSAILFFIIAFCSHNLTAEAEDPIRKGKFLGITGYLSGSTDGFRLAPFWKQWNALLQVNVEKNKHKFNGFYVVPASSLYYPYDNYGYGFYHPHSLGGLGGLGGVNSLGGLGGIGGIGGINNFGGLGGLNGLGAGLANLNYRPPLLFDENKAQTTTLAPIISDPDDKPKLDFDEDDDDIDVEEIDDNENEIYDRLPPANDQNVSVFNLNVRDDRKTHKRDIVHKNHTEDEVVATVMEITESVPTANSTTATESGMETTTATETEIPNSTEGTVSTSTVSETEAPSPTPTPTTNTTSGPTPSPIDPILSFYYGGNPNENAGSIYFTTIEPNQNLAPPTEKPNVQANDRNDNGVFKPSIQYTYRNYRYDTDPHFVPIVGTKQIF